MHFASMYQKGKIMNWDFEGEMYSQKKKLQKKKMRVYICPKNERIEQQEQIFLLRKVNL